MTETKVKNHSLIGSCMPLIHNGVKIDAVYVVGVDVAVLSLQGKLRKKGLDVNHLASVLGVLDERDVNVTPAYSPIDKVFIKELMPEFQEKAVNAQKFFLDNLNELSEKNVIVYYLKGKTVLSKHVLSQLRKVGVTILEWNGFGKISKEPITVIGHDNKVIYSKLKNPVAHLEVVYDKGNKALKTVHFKGYKDKANLVSDLYTTDSFVVENEGLYTVQVPYPAGGTQFQAEEFTDKVLKGLETNDVSFLVKQVIEEALSEALSDNYLGLDLVNNKKIDFIH